MSGVEQERYKLLFSHAYNRTIDLFDSFYPFKWY